MDFVPNGPNYNLKDDERTLSNLAQSTQATADCSPICAHAQELLIFLTYSTAVLHIWF